MTTIRSCSVKLDFSIGIRAAPAWLSVLEAIDPFGGLTRHYNQRYDLALGRGIALEVSDEQAVRPSYIKSLPKYVKVAPPRSRLPMTTGRLSRNPIIWSAVGVVTLSASTYCGVGYLHYKACRPL